MKHAYAGAFAACLSILVGCGDSTTTSSDASSGSTGGSGGMAGTGGSGGMAGTGGSGGMAGTGGAGGMAGTGGAGGMAGTGGAGGMMGAGGSGGQGGSGGGQLSPEQVCMNLCTLLEQCFGPSTCLQDCTADLLDCDATQLQALDNCPTQFTDCQNIQTFADCLVAVACVEG